ncbi:MAG: nitrilase, partial [Solirubrobacterales bacterium]|nr:nitrilase [Solirubrobacterales bacterium]
MSRPIEVAAVQVTARPGEVERNLERFARAIREHARGAELIVGPETLAAGYDLELIDARGAALAEDLDGPTATLTRELAAETGATIVVGVLERDGEALHDSALIVGADDASTRIYRKTHLYPPERRRFRAGDELLTARTP